jgi:hypothetical protein
MSKRMMAYSLVLLVGIIIGATLQPFRLLPAVAQGGCHTFPETGKTVCGRFLQYWQQNGGLAQQGYPITNQFAEVSDLDGKTYTVQYFERAVFEAHPENQAPYDILLSQLGTFRLKAKYPNGDPSGGQIPPPPSQATPTTAPPPPSGQPYDIGPATAFKDSIGYLHVVGVIHYNGSDDRARPNVTVTLSDASSKVLATQNSSDSPNLVKPGTLIPYLAIFDSPPSSYAHIEVTIQADKATDFDETENLTNFAIDQPSIIQPANDYDPLKVVGRVVNNNTKAATFVEIIVVMYDGSGRVLDVASSFAKQDTIEAGQSSPFEVDSYNAKGTAKVDFVMNGSPSN